VFFQRPESGMRFVSAMSRGFLSGGGSGLHR
jgi:hypothetical protein